MTDQSDEIMRSLGKLEGKVDMILDRSEERDGRYDKHSSRIARLEKDRNVTHGVHITFAAILSAVGWPTIKTWLGL